jgi:hypothetical protein
LIHSRVRPLFVALFASAVFALSASGAAAQNVYQISQSQGVGITPGETLVAGTNCDDCVATVALPFNYTFYGQQFNTANVSSNGVLQFASASNDYGQFQICFPLSQFSYAILAHWTDLQTNGAGEGIYTSTTGEVGNRVFNIEWRASYNFLPPGTLNFEIRLYENQQRFDIVYGNIGGSGTSAPGGGINVPTVGVQKGTGADYTAFSSACGSVGGGLRNGLALTFTGTSNAARFIAGLVTDPDGNPLSGVNVTLGGDSSQQVATDMNGRYSFTNLAGANYNVTPSQTNSNFYPASRAFGSGSFTSFSGSQIVNFVRTPAPQAGDLLISEFRFHGPRFISNEFVELYNNTNSAIVVNTTDGSSGWLLQAASASPVTGGQATYILPRGTVIPARTHFLVAGTGYDSLFLYAPGDDFFSDDIPDDNGIAIFSTANSANLNTATRLDAVGFNNPTTPVAALYREGAGLAPVGAYSGEHSFVRKMTSGVPQDTDDNAQDFVLVSTSLAQTPTGVQPIAGAPGPENLYSPVMRNSQLKASYIDFGCVGVGTDPTTACARVRVTTPIAGAPVGTLSIRRRWTNHTSTPVTSLRFRIVDMTTLGNRGAGDADLRLLSSSDVTLTGSNGLPVNLKALTLEQSPPAQTSGGGINSSMRVGSITLDAPLAPNAGVNLEFRLGVQVDGNYRFIVNIEAQTSTPPPPTATSTPNAPKIGGYLQQYPKTLPNSVKP